MCFDRESKDSKILGQPVKNKWQVTDVMPALKKYRKLGMEDNS